MTRPTARVLALLELLQSGGTRTVGDLATRLGVDERTVRRYADHLNDLDVPIESVRGRYGGYRLAPGFRMPPLMLTEDEGLAMMLGLVAARHAGLVTSSDDAADTAAAKLRRALPIRLRERLDALLQVTRFTASAGGSTAPETGALLAVAEAAGGRHPMTICYTAANGRRTERTVKPYGLVAHEGRWYLAGADSSRGQVRTFRVDRITDPRVLPDRFEVPAGFDATTHVLTGLAQSPHAHDVSILMQATFEEVRSKLPEALATVVPVEPASGNRLGTAARAGATPGWLEVQLRVEHLDWLPGILATLDRPFVIQRPDELRILVRQLAGRLDRYAEA